MIERVTGKLIEKHPPHLVIDVNGIGYAVDAPMSTIFNCPDVGEPLTLFTHLAIRDDAHQLYGFIAAQDRALFRALIKVNGVGNKSALAILSTLDADTLSYCLTTGDTAMLTQAPGIGKKTAERILIELQDKQASWSLPNSDLTSSTTKPGAIDVDSMTPKENAQTDAIAALTSLGYKAAEASKLVKKFYTPDVSIELLIKQCLQNKAAV